MKHWIEAMRPRTLPVAVAGVLTGVGYVVFMGKLRVIPAILCMLFALLAQIVSNFANEYYDYKRGADKKGRQGFRRGVTEGDISPRAMRNITYATLAVACVVGCCLIPYGGWELILVGIAVALFALAYSTGPYPLSYHGLGDIAVLVFFGVVPVNFTYYVQTLQWSLPVFLASLSIGLLAVNVLLVNNYRDYEDDKAVGKRTTVVIFGRNIASKVYLINGFIATALLDDTWLVMPYWAIVIVGVYLVLHYFTWKKLEKSEGAVLNKVLGATARNMLILALLLFVALLWHSL